MKMIGLGLIVIGTSLPFCLAMWIQKESNGVGGILWGFSILVLLVVSLARIGNRYLEDGY